MVALEQKDVEKHELKAKNNELRKEVQSLTKKLEEKEKNFKEKVEKSYVKKVELEDRLVEMAEER